MLTKDQAVAIGVVALGLSAIVAHEYWKRSKFSCKTVLITGGLGESRFILTRPSTTEETRPMLPEHQMGAIKINTTDITSIPRDGFQDGTDTKTG